MKNRVRRQSAVNRLIHWGTALSIILLIITGLGQMPLYKRYNVIKLPGGEWLSSFFNTLDLHYLAAMILIFVVTFHLVYHSTAGNTIYSQKRGFKESYVIIKAMLTRVKNPLQRSIWRNKE
jgi:cytochrome b subunit of formate dehydrogenase